MHVVHCMYVCMYVCVGVGVHVCGMLSICILNCVQWYTNYSFHFAALYLIAAVSILHNF